MTSMDTLAASSTSQSNGVVAATAEARTNNRGRFSSRVGKGSTAKWQAAITAKIKANPMAEAEAINKAKALAEAYEKPDGPSTASALQLVADRWAFYLSTCHLVQIPGSMTAQTIDDNDIWLDEIVREHAPGFLDFLVSLT